MLIIGAAGDPISGWSWARIGQMSRVFHRTQGMGRWTGAEEARDWPLHLVLSHVDGPDDALWSGMPNSLGDLATLTGAAPIANDLIAAQSGIDAAVAAFPDFETVAKALDAALAAIRRARWMARRWQRSQHYRRRRANQRIPRNLRPRRSACAGDGRHRCDRPRPYRLARAV